MIPYIDVSLDPLPAEISGPFIAALSFALKKEPYDFRTVMY